MFTKKVLSVVLAAVLTVGAVSFARTKGIFAASAASVKVAATIEEGIRVDSGFSEGLAFVVKNNPTNDGVTAKSGFINTKGEIAIPLEYDTILEKGYTTLVFKEGLAAARKGESYSESWGYIDKTGKVVIPFEYDYASSFSEGVAIVSKGNKSFVIDKTGKTVFSFDGYIDSDFHDGLAVVRVKGGSGYGYVDKTGKIVIPCEYIMACDFSEGLAAVEVIKDNRYQWGYIDKTGKVVIPAEYVYVYNANGGNDLTDKTREAFSEGITIVYKDKSVGAIDKAGNVVVPFEYASLSAFKEGLAAARLTRDGKKGYVDKTGNVVIPFEYDDARPFSEGLAAVKKDGKWGFIDKTGQIAVSLEYLSVYDFNGGFATARKGDRSYILEAKGYAPVANGTKLGDVLYTDIRAYINGAEIPCYAINGATYVVIADLANYGFNVAWNGTARTSTVTFVKGKAVKPMTVTANKGKVGAVAYPYLHTDICAVINGAKVQGVAVNGSVAIPFNALSPFGDYSWDGAARMSKLTVK